MGRIGTLTEWSRFLDARTPDEACGELSKYESRLEELYTEVSALAGPLWNSPSGDVAEVLMAARTAITDAIQLLESVRVRFDNGPEAA